MFGMGLQSTLLGALLTFAGTVWYASHLTTSTAWGLRPLEEGTLELKHFFLVPEVRGRGLGRVLLAGVEEVARSVGARRERKPHRTGMPQLQVAAAAKSELRFRFS